MALGPAPAVPAGLSGGPCALHSSVAQRGCLWGVRSPRGEFLRERGRLKIVALGSKSAAVSFALACSLTLGSGPEGPFLGLLVSPLPRPTTPFSSNGTVDPGRAKGPRVLGASAPADTQDGGQKPLASSAPGS